MNTFFATLRDHTAKWIKTLAAGLLVGSATFAQATVIEVREGERIQDAVNQAAPGRCLIHRVLNALTFSDLDDGRLGKGGRANQ